MTEVEVRRQSYLVVALDSWLAAPPPAVWPFVSDPEGLNKWSTAPIRGLEPGDGGGYGTVGALREVVLPRPMPALIEAVQYADAPTRFVYRAVGSRAIRYHRGEIRLTPEGDGTRLRWQYGADLAVPGAAAYVRRTIPPQLEASVRRLASVVPGAPIADFPGSGFVDDDERGALEAAEATAERLLVLADEMEAAGDSRHWFSRVYQYVTEEMVGACRRGEVAHPTWALRLIPGFHDLYRRNLESTPEPHWHEAFAAIDAAEGKSGSAALAFWQALVAGARAHIEGDLPRVLAATYAQHYRGRCDYQRFRADFLLLGAPLQQAWQRLAARVPPRWFPLYLRVLEHLLPPEAVEHLTAKRFYDPLTARRSAFEQGRSLVPADADPPA